MKLGDILKECSLPPSTIKELSTILFGINTLKHIEVSTCRQKTGKNLLTLTALRSRIRVISKKCDTTDEVAVSICESTSSTKETDKSKASDNDSKKTVSDEETKLTSTATKMKPPRNRNNISTINNDDDVVDPNIDRLTDQVLNLPREYRPICLAQDETIRSKNSNHKNGDDESSNHIDVPTLPEITNEIYVHNAGADSMSANDEELTVSCVETSIPEPNEIQKKREKD